MARTPRTTPAAANRAATLSVQPIDLRLGDAFTDEAGTWEVVGRPTTQRGGKKVRVMVQRPGEPVTLRERWSLAYERVTVMRNTSARRVKARVIGKCGRSGLTKLR